MITQARKAERRQAARERWDKRRRNQTPHHCPQESAGFNLEPGRWQFHLKRVVAGRHWGDSCDNIADITPK
jgi:hypothetical protein